METTKAARIATADSFRMGRTSRRALRLCKKAVGLVAVVVFTLVVCERDAHAYLDPGTTNFILQTLVGAVLGAAIYIKLSWVQIKVRIGRLFSSKDEEEEES